MKIAICDDESVIAHDIKEQISAMLTAKNKKHSIDVFFTPEKLLSENCLTYTILFLDVDMGKWNGIDVAKQIRQYDPNVIIVYISGYVQYSPLGYTVNAFRYLLKTELEDTLEECLDDIINTCQNKPETFVIKQSCDFVTLLLQDIVFIESQRATLLFYMAGNENNPHKTYDTMKSIEDQLQAKGFLRVQKSYLVNYLYVQQIKNYQVTLTNGQTIPASRTNFQNLKRQYMLWKGR